MFELPQGVWLSQVINKYILNHFGVDKEMNVLTLSAQMIRNADFKFANVCTFSDILIVNYVILKLSNDTLS